MTWKKFVVREKSDLREREKVSVREVVTSELSWIVQVVALLFLLWMQLLNGGKNGEKIVMVCRLWRKTIWLKQCCLCEHVVCWKLNFFEKVMRNMRDSVVSSVREKFRFLVTNDCVCGFRKKSWQLMVFDTCVHKLIQSPPTKMHPANKKKFGVIEFVCEIHELTWRCLVMFLFGMNGVMFVNFEIWMFVTPQFKFVAFHHCFCLNWEIG